MKDWPRDKGAVLLTTLLVMAVIAALAVAILDDIRVSVKRAANMSSYAQADWYMKASEDFAISFIAQEISGKPDAALNAAFKREQNVPLPIEGGVINFNIRDGSHCLVISTIDKGSGPEQLRRLLEYLGWSTSEAAGFISVLKDWQDADTTPLPGGAEDYTYLGLEPAYRTPNRPIVSLSELRALEGMTEERFQLLRPFLCVGDGVRTTAININTAHLGHAYLIAALLGDDQLATAQQLLEERPAAGFSEDGLGNAPVIKGLIEQDEDAAKNMDLKSFIYTPSTVWIETDVAFYEARRTAVFEFQIDNERTNRTYRRLSAEARRPRILDPELENEPDIAQ